MADLQERLANFEKDIPDVVEVWQIDDLNRKRPETYATPGQAEAFTIVRPRGRAIAEPGRLRRMGRRYGRRQIVRIQVRRTTSDWRQILRPEMWAAFCERAREAATKVMRWR